MSAERRLQPAVVLERPVELHPHGVGGVGRAAERRVGVAQQRRVGGDAGEEAGEARDEVVQALRVAAGDDDREPGDHDREEGDDPVQVEHDRDGDDEDQAEERGEPVAPLDVVRLEGDWIGHRAASLVRLPRRIVAAHPRRPHRPRLREAAAAAHPRRVGGGAPGLH